MRFGEAFIDANLLVLLVVGRVGRGLVGKRRRAQQFLPEDYDRLSEAVEDMNRVFVTPNTLTEASNLLESGDRRFLAQLRKLIEESEEVTVASIAAARNGAFPKLGLSDAVSIEALSPDRPLITADFDLYVAALAAKGDGAAFNFNWT